MKYLSILLFLSILLTSSSIRASVVYQEIQELGVSEYSIENPVGVEDINLKIKKGTINMLVINTDDYLESIVLTKNFDELLYLECDDLIDDAQSYNVDGNEYDLGSISGQELIIGFRFPTVGNSFHYGWMKLKIGDDAETFDFIEYAYEDLVDTKITACETGFVGTQDVTMMDIYVYPNPAQEYIRISTNEERSCTRAEFINSNGILQKQMNCERDLFIGDLTKGMYKIVFYENDRLVAVTNFMKL